jgi:hypothetical protein
MDILLYYAPNACSLVPYVTLTEAGAKFESEHSISQGTSRSLQII